MKKHAKRSFLKSAIPMVATAAMLFAGCTKDIKDDVNKLKDDVNSLNSLKELVEELKNSVNSGAVITSIENPYSDANGTGIKINYTGNKAPSIIYNGKAGATPVMSIDAQGYWCVNDIRVVPNVLAKGVAGNSVKVTENADKSVSIQIVDAYGANVGSAVKIPAPIDGINGKSVTAVKNVDGSIDIFEVMNGVNGAKLATIPAPSDGANGTGFDISIDGLVLTITPINADGTRGNPSIVTLANGTNGTSVRATTNADGSVTIQNYDASGAATGSPATIYQPKAPSIAEKPGGTDVNGIAMLTLTVTSYNADGSVASTTDIVTSLPVVQDNILTAVNYTEGDEYYDFVTKSGSYKVLSRHAKDYPTSVSILTSKIMIVRDGVSEFRIRVNPSHAIDFDKTMVALDYISGYSRSQVDATAPDFVELVDVVPVSKSVEGETVVIPGEYTVKLAWKDCAVATPNQHVFVILNYKDRNDKLCSITSSTPAEMEIDDSNTDYVTDAIVEVQANASIFADQTYSGELILKEPNMKKNIVIESIEHYSNASAFTITVDPADPYKFTLKANDDAFSTTFPNVDKFEAPVCVTFYDKDNLSITYTYVKFITVTIYKVADITLNNAPTDFIPHLVAGRDIESVDDDLTAALTTMGYSASDITNATIASTSYKNGTDVFANENAEITATLVNGKYKVHVGWNIPANTTAYTVTSTISIVSREVIVSKSFTIEKPEFLVKVKDDAKFVSDIYEQRFITADASIKVSDIVDVKSCRMNIPNPTSAIVYEFDATDAAILADATHGMRATTALDNNVATTKFEITAADQWGVAKSLSLSVKLKSGQIIPVEVVNQNGTTAIGTLGILQAKLLNNKLASVGVTTPKDIAYSDYINTNFDLSTLVGDFSDVLGQTMIKKDVIGGSQEKTRIASVVYTASAPSAGIIPEGKNLVNITGNMLQMVDGYAWAEQVIEQDVVVTVTDIWGTVKTNTITLKVYSKPEHIVL